MLRSSATGGPLLTVSGVQTGYIGNTAIVAATEDVVVLWQEISPMNRRWMTANFFEPLILSASALLYASLRLPILASMPASGSRSD
jgi:hypothetical protein